MALTGRILCNIYGKGINPVGGVGGVTNSFPSAQCYFYAKTNTFSGVTTNSLIVLLPQATAVFPTEYYAVETIAQLASNGT